jgi:hypothetical protein
MIGVLVLDTYDLTKVDYKDISNVISDKVYNELMEIWNRIIEVKFNRFIFTKKYKISADSATYLDINKYTLIRMIKEKVSITQNVEVYVELLNDYVEVQVVIIRTL